MSETASFEDLVAAIKKARGLFDLSHLSLDVMQQGLADLQQRLENLEQAQRKAAGQGE
jgi:hypothetical protein